MPCDEPGFVVARGELDERGAQLFDRIEGLHPKQVLLQGSYEAFGDAVALGFAYEGGRSFDAQAFDFILEIAGHVVGAVIVTQFQATRHAGRDGSEAPMHALAHRLQRLETIGRTRGVNADDFRRVHRARVLSRPKPRLRARARAILSAWRRRHSFPGPPAPAAGRATVAPLWPSCAERKNASADLHRRPRGRFRQLWESAPAPLRACARHQSSFQNLRLRFN